MRNLSWSTLTPRKKTLFVDLLWSDGHTELAIANFLKTTKGAIVGHRHRHVSTVTRVSTKLKNVVDPERFRDLRELEKLTQTS